MADENRQSEGAAAPRPGLVLGVVLGVVLGATLLATLNLLASPHFDLASPLPWDMSHHYLGALEFRDALMRGSVAELSESLLQKDLYPPVHSILFGTWIAGGGESWWSFSLFLWVTLAGFVSAVAIAVGSTPRGKSRIAVVLASAFLGASPRLMALAGSYLVDFVAGVLMLSSIAQVARCARNGRGGDSRSCW